MGKYLRRCDGGTAVGEDLLESGDRRRPRSLCKAGRPASREGTAPPERDVDRWHSTVLEHLRGEDHAAALPLLGRLALVLPREHGARPGILAALGHVLCELERFDRALEVAGEALRLRPGLPEAAMVAQRARRAMRP